MSNRTQNETSRKRHTETLGGRHTETQNVVSARVETEGDRENGVDGQRRRLSRQVTSKLLQLKGTLLAL